MPVLPLHMGALHPYEQVLTLLLAFGPFVVLGVVVALRRRADRDEERGAPAESTEQGAEDRAQDQRAR
jgi:hypothetical protein